MGDTVYKSVLEKIEDAVVMTVDAFVELVFSARRSGLLSNGSETMGDMVYKAGGVMLNEKVREVIEDAVVTVVSSHQNGLLSAEQYERLKVVKKIVHLRVRVFDGDKAFQSANCGRDVKGDLTDRTEDVTCPKCLEWFAN